MICSGEPVPGTRGISEAIEKDRVRRILLYKVHLETSDHSNGRDADGKKPMVWTALVTVAVSCRRATAPFCGFIFRST
jgi:hypothetical protein